MSRLEDLIAGDGATAAPYQQALAALKAQAAVDAAVAAAQPEVEARDSPMPSVSAGISEVAGSGPAIAAGAAQAQRQVQIDRIPIPNLLNIKSYGHQIYRIPNQSNTNSIEIKSIDRQIYRTPNRSNNKSISNTKSIE